MKSFRKELWFNLPNRRGFVNITPEVEAALSESGIREGMVLVNAMHITASVFINDDESGLHHDYEEWLEGLASGDGAGGSSGHLQRPVGFRPVGADFLRGVRRAPPQARADQNHR